MEEQSEEVELLLLCGSPPLRYGTTMTRELHGNKRWNEKRRRERGTICCCRRDEFCQKQKKAESHHRYEKRSNGIHIQNLLFVLRSRRHHQGVEEEEVEVKWNHFYSPSLSFQYIVVVVVVDWSSVQFCYKTRTTGSPHTTFVRRARKTKYH
eukprot:scaffold17653_cov68-Cylindrotheca_fusiformis.AAC.3